MARIAYAEPTPRARRPVSSASQRAEDGIGDPSGLLPQATQVPIPAYVQPCSPAQSIVNPTKLLGRVKEASHAD